MDMYEILAAACGLAGALYAIAKFTKSDKDDKFFAKAKSILEQAKSFFRPKNKEDNNNQENK